METKNSTFQEEGKRIIQKAESIYEEYSKSLNDLINTINNHELIKVDNTIMDKLTKTREIGDETDKALVELAQYKTRRGKEMFEESNGIYTEMRNLLITFVIIATLVGILLGVFLTLSITRPVNRIVNTAKK